MVDVNTLDYATLGTAIIAILMSIGGAVVISGRGKFVAAISDMALLLVDISVLMTAFTAAIGDDQITPEEIADLKTKALAIQMQVAKIKSDLGM